MAFLHRAQENTVSRTPLSRSALTKDQDGLPVSRAIPVIIQGYEDKVCKHKWRNTMINNPEAAHPDRQAPARTGILLTNLGTPGAPTPAALRRYLAEFLWDRRVVDAPRPLWWLILHGLILRTRPRRSAAAYRKIWGETGSPLLAIGRRQAEGLQQALADGGDDGPRVVLAMRYGQPSIRAGLERLRELNANRILVLPLYPQYSATTTASTFDAIAGVFRDWPRLPELRMVMHYHDHPAYIAALAASIRDHWREHERGERLLFSFHGIPQDYFEAGDPYPCECHKTARLVAEALGLPEDAWALAFQSRFGPRAWVQPYADDTLREWAAQGHKRVDVICPGFAADCLETLEEIALRYRALFLDAGGKAFHYIPALNDQDAHIQVLAGLVREHGAGWPD